MGSLAAWSARGILSFYQKIRKRTPVDCKVREKSWKIKV